MNRRLDEKIGISGNEGWDNYGANIIKVHYIHVKINKLISNLSQIKQRAIKDIQS